MSIPEQVIMTARLMKITPHWKEIMNVLGPDTFLCGGLVLQTILGETWDSDIDIFTTNRDLTQFDFGTWTSVEKESAYTIIPGVIKVYSGCVTSNDQNSDQKIDIIQMTSLEEAFSGFDFDFCKVWFDGYHFHIKHPEAVLSKTCTINNDLVTLRKADVRIPKYESRGFTINR